MRIAPKSIIFVTLCLFSIFIYNWIRYSIIDKVVWSISIYSGMNPYEFVPHPDLHKIPALTANDVNDVPAIFVADPFMIQDNAKWHMFFEVFNSLSNQGDIGLASSSNGVDWHYEKIVIDEPFHLSYPYVFKWNGTYFMIPETRIKSAIKLYKAIEFPYKWSFAGDLIFGNFADSSVVYKNNKWWLFTLKDRDALVLYYADNPTGPWIEHPDSPLVEGDKNIARPGGRIIVVDDKIIRYVQDGDPIYGNALRAFEVDAITTTIYKDHEIAKSPILEASGSGWNSNGMHHADPHRLNDATWIACVDGKTKKVVFDLQLGAKELPKKAKQSFRRTICKFIPDKQKNKNSMANRKEL